MVSSLFNCRQRCEINKSNCENWKNLVFNSFSMQYDSQLEVIWAKLSSEGPLRRPTSSRPSFRNVCDAFYQAEECTLSPVDLTLLLLGTILWTVYFRLECRVLRIWRSIGDGARVARLCKANMKHFHHLSLAQIPVELSVLGLEKPRVKVE
jgi:hypothetical protein